VAVIAARRRPDLHWQPRHSDHERHRLDGPDPPQPSSLRRSVALAGSDWSASDSARRRLPAGAGRRAGAAGRGHQRAANRRRSSAHPRA